MLDVSGIRISLDAGLPGAEAQRAEEVARQLGCSCDELFECELVRRAVDARKKTNVHFTTTFRVALGEAAEARLLENPPRGCTVRQAKPHLPLEYPQLEAPKTPPVVVGAGPAGLFCALYLARCGLRPIVLERGQAVEQRAQDVARFQQAGVLDPDSNIQFGEGGAGTFSDGKLTTNIKNPLTPHVLRLFVEAGAPASILTEAHPHLGSDNLPAIVRAMREEIVERGGQVCFGARFDGWRFEAGRVRAVRVRDAQTGKVDELLTNQLVLACGHSARDVFKLAHDAGLAMERKPFSVGVRIEHSQAAVNEAQWGAAATHPALGAAEYKMAVHLPSGRSVYTFCMCPGGEVVAAASEEGGVVTNGMSCFARDGANANAALLVNVDPADFPGEDVLAGVAFQREIEQAAYECAQRHGGTPYQAPCQRVGDFLGAASQAGGRAGGAAQPSTFSQGAVRPTYGRGVVEAPLRECLPPFVIDALAEALPLMGRKLRGFDSPDALMTAPETRSSSPIRIKRAVSLQAYFANDMQAGAGDSESDALTGIYPCGEGPGYAGGIMSAACDGLRVAQAVARECAQRVTES